MNREQRKYACEALDRICAKKHQGLEDEYKAKLSELDDKSPARAYMAALGSNNKERAILMDKILQYFVEHNAVTHSNDYWGFNVAFSLGQDTRDPETVPNGIETPLMHKIKKTYYDAVDKLLAEHEARCAKLDAYVAALKDQVWLSDLPGELADMLKQLEAEVF